MVRIVLWLIIPLTCNGFFFNNPSSWDGLKVTWGINPFSSFKDMPRTRDDALANGWVTMLPYTDCDDHANFKGNRYIKNADMGVILIYDSNGYIAGIQIGIPENYSPNPNNFPPVGMINSSFILDSGNYYLTAYFVNPETVCVGRTAEQFAQDGTGEGLWIQTGLNPITNHMNIPLQQSHVDETRWTQGKCFYLMGMHYWYNIREDMSCDEFFPVFLMYNDGVLNSFGWALGIDIVTSEYLEHPQQSSYDKFLRPVPTCLNSRGRMTTLHIFMTDSVLYNLC